MQNTHRIVGKPLKATIDIHRCFLYDSMLNFSKALSREAAVLMQLETQDGHTAKDPGQ